MRIIAVVLGVFCAGIGLLLMWFDKRIMRKTTCHSGEISGIDDSWTNGVGPSYSISVKFVVEGKTIELPTMHFFPGFPFFEKMQINRLRKKYIGKPVHIYYHRENSRQLMIREFLWKRYLLSGMLVLAGGLAIVAGMIG